MAAINTIEELLIDLGDENPPPRGLDWYCRDNFDPMHGLSEIKYAEQRGWIEVERPEDGEVRFRMTDRAVEASKLWPRYETPGPNSIMLKARDLVKDLLADGIEEKWIPRANFDPPHRVSEIRKAARLSLIEIQETGEAASLKMRLTKAGRIQLANVLKVEAPQDIPAPSPAM